MDELNNNTQSDIKAAPIAKVSGVATDEKSITKPAEAETQPTADDAADLFSAVYINQKASGEEISRNIQSFQTTVVSPGKKNKKKAENKKFNIIFIVLIIITAVLFIAASIYLVYGIYNNDSDNNQQNEDKSNTVSAEITSPFNYEYIYSDDYPDGIQEKYKKLYDQSSNIAGWITVPGTSIDMPVYQTNSNTYYVRHDNYDVYNRYGTANLDMYCDIESLSKNTVVYAHNFDNGLIFDELHNFTDLEFVKENPVIEFNTIYKDYKWKVIASFYTNGDSTGDNDYLFYFVAVNMGNNSFMEFYDEIQQRSIIHTGVDVVPTDKILTLVTCTYFFDRNGSVENARLGVVARLVREGESEEVDTSRFTLNENVRYPQLYYDVFGGTNPYANASRWEATND